MPGHKVLICLSQSKKSILLNITDDGGGFYMGKKQEGIGIGNIKSRAAAYSSNAEFVSFPGKRCVLSVSLTVVDELLKKV